MIPHRKKARSTVILLAILNAVLLLLLALNAELAAGFSVESPSCLRTNVIHHRPLLVRLESTVKEPESVSRKRVNGVAYAPDLVKSLVEGKHCYTTESGARAFVDACAANVIYDDCFEPKPFVGKEAVTNHMLNKIASRRNKGELRLDRITDGSTACGFAWTWTCKDKEGLRGTTFVELNPVGKIEYVREICEPIYKPGDSMLKLLRSISGEREPRPPVDYVKRTPTIASEIGKYLFCDVQWSDIQEAMRFLDENIFCRDFNYEESVSGKEEVGEFAEGIGNLPGIVFRGQKFDDGDLSTCYVWEIDLKGSPEPVKGISFQELNPDTRLIAYMRDLSAPTIMPPILGKIARFLRPGIGVFRGVKLGSRPGGK